MPAPYSTADSNAIASAMRMTRSSRSSGRRRTSAVTRREVGKQPHHVQDDCVVFNRGWTGLDSSFLQRRPSQRGCSTSKPTGHTRSNASSTGGIASLLALLLFRLCPWCSRTAPKFLAAVGVSGPFRAGRFWKRSATAWPPVKLSAESVEYNWVCPPWTNSPRRSVMHRSLSLDLLAALGAGA